MDYKIGPIISAVFYSNDHFTSILFFSPFLFLSDPCAVHTKIAGIQTRPIIRAQRLENIHLCLRFLGGKGVETQHLSADGLYYMCVCLFICQLGCLSVCWSVFSSLSEVLERERSKNAASQC